MGDAPPSATTLLTYALDEIRETTTLLRVADLGRETRRPWWRNVFFGVVRTQGEVRAGQAVQYLGENIDRARDHWREALAHLQDLERSHVSNELVVGLGEELRRAGLLDVLAGLRHDAVPRPMAEAAAHLSGVVDKLRECDRIVVKTRSQMMLR